MEIWKSIPGYEGLYEASTYGRIRTVDGKTTKNKKHTIRRWKSRILSGRGNNSATGFRVGLWKNGACKDWLVARLVGITFLGFPPDISWTINHKDGNRFNNNVENLEWLTLADNIRHGFATGLYKCQKQVALKNGNEYIMFKSLEDAGRHIGRGRGYIHRCVRCGRDATSITGVKYAIHIQQTGGENETTLHRARNKEPAQAANHCG